MHLPIRTLIVVAVFAMLLIALPFAAVAQGVGGQEKEQTGATQDTQSQSFMMLGKEIKIDSTVKKGEQAVELVINEETGDIVWEIHGDVSCTAEKLNLHCSLLTLYLKNGQVDRLEAKGIAKKPATIELSDLKASTDNIVFLAGENVMRLLGNVHVVQEAGGFRTEIFGDYLERSEKTNGSSEISVKENPRLIRKATAIPAVIDQTAQTTLNAGAIGPQAVAPSMSLGQEFELTADPEKGEFLLILSGGAGVIESFTARNKVHLNSNDGELEIECTQLDLRDNGQRIEASGLPVKIHQGGIDASARNLVLDATAGKSMLKGNARIDNENLGGAAFQSNAEEEIHLLEKGAGGLTTILWFGSSQIAFQQNAEKTANNAEVAKEKSTKETLDLKIEK